jgi:predicted nucleic acid-binding protein
VADIIDASVLIDCLRGVPEAQEHLRAARDRDRLATHFVAAAEVITGARNRSDLKGAASLLRRFEMVPANESDSAHALRLLRRHRLAGGVGWPGFLIAATCVCLGHAIVTLKDKHFRVFRGVRVIRPY